MASIRKLSELFRAIAMADIDGATAIGYQICKNEEKKGHRTAARALRGALNAGSGGAQSNGVARSIPYSEGMNVLSAALVHLKDPRTFSNVMLTPSIRTELESVILEWRHSVRLRQRGISPRSKLLFHGPPGCGKSLTAQALGQELGLPVYMVRFDAVIGAFLGQTAIHLRQLFHFAETTPCILLLDELDALGKRRGSPLDVGELDRIVISLLQELEHSKPMGVVIATTNLPKHLDDALWRRFDLDIYFKSPSPVILRSFVKQLAEGMNIVLRTDVVRRATRVRSFAAAERIVIAEARQQALPNLKNK